MYADGRRSGRCQRLSELGRARLDRLGNGDDEPAVTIDQPAGIDDGEPDDAVGAGLEAEHVTLGRLLALGLSREPTCR